MTLHREPCVVCGAIFHQEQGGYLVDYLVNGQPVWTCGDKHCAAQVIRLSFLRDEILAGERSES